jgi:hypothetical protein
MNPSRLRPSSRTLGAATALALIGAAACGGKMNDGSLGSTEQALSGADAGTITISGTVVDPNDGPQAGITITLSGSANAQVVTDFSGSFKFTVTPGGSYSLTAQGNDNFFAPPFHSCLTITPSIVNLNNLTTSTNIPFVGSGTDQVLNCSPPEAVGAFTGPLTVSGKVTSGGLPVAGARVLLSGSTQGFRSTDETGAYSFSVSPGSYSVNPTGGNCASFAPSVVNLNNLKSNAAENFTGTGCPPAPLTFCPTFDKLLGLSEPVSCNTISTASCEVDRLSTWAGEIVSDFQFVEDDELGLNDCRFGKWQSAPIVSDFTFVGVLEQQGTNLNIFTLQLFGCAAVNNLIGPLNLLGSLVPPDLIQAGLTFTTADISALEDEYMAAINQALADFGLGPLTAAQTTAIRAQLDFAASKTPGIIASSKLSYSTCAADAGAD